MTLRPSVHPSTVIQSGDFVTPVANILASRAVSTTVEKTDTSTIECLSARLLDALAIIGSGDRSTTASIARDYLRMARNFDTEVSLSLPDLGDLSLEDAGFLLGGYAFSQNFADTSLPAVTHPGSVVIPALLVAGMAQPVSGLDGLSAIAAGYDAMEVTGRALNGNPRMGHQIRGFRPTATCGPIAAVVTIGRAWRMSESQIANGICLAANHGGGLRRHSGGEAGSIRLQSAEAVRRGVAALLQSQAGLEASPTMLEGDGGFFAAYQSESLDAAALDLADRSLFAAAHESAAKIHCVAHTIVPVLDGLLELVLRNELKPDDVEKIECLVPHEHAIISVPGLHENARVGGSYELACAVVLANGDYIWPDEAARGVSSLTRELASKVTVQGDDEMSHAFRSDVMSWPAQVVVTTKSGETLTAKRDAPDTLGYSPKVRDLIARKAAVLGSAIGVPDMSANLWSAVSKLPTETSVWDAIRTALPKHDVRSGS